MKALVITISGCLIAMLAFGQDLPTFKVNVEEVQVHATVTDSAGQYVRELKPEYFEIVEDGKPQKIEGFTSGDGALSAGIVLDVGGTMKGNLAIVKEGAMAFLNAGRLDNEYFLVEFNNKAELTQDITGDPVKLRDHTAFLKSSSDKAPYDGIYLGLDRLRAGPQPRKVVLVLTSGGPMKNEHSAAQVRNLARQLDAQIFSVDLPPDYDVHGEFGDKETTANIIEPLGGRNFVSTSGADYLNICRRIAVLLRNQYEIAYRSTNTAHDGKYRHVQVKLHLPKGAPELFVQAREGYYAAEP